MTRPLLAASLAVLIAPLAHAADPGAEQALRQTEQSLADAVVRNDTAPFEQALAPDFTFIAPDGGSADRAGVLGDMRSGNLKIASTVPTDMQVRVYGDAAVVTYGSTDHGTYKGTDISGQYRWTDVFVKQGGRWRIVASQGTPVPPPPAPKPAP